MINVTLCPLKPDDREQFIRDNKEAFNYGALVEFGRRDDHFEKETEIISRETIEHCIDSGEAYRIMAGDKMQAGLSESGGQGRKGAEYGDGCCGSEHPQGV